MANHKMSESEEMYLVTIARLEESGLRVPIPISMLADELAIQPVSTNQMIRKLEEAELVSYEPYKGVALKAAGKSIALRILRHRRLWEVFLVEKLKLPINVAKEQACQMEHVAPVEMMERLADYLGGPGVSPEGKPIPSVGSVAVTDKEIPLNRLKVNDTRIVAHLSGDQASRAFLEHAGIVPGAAVTILGAGSDTDMLVEVEGRAAYLSSSLANTVRVNPDIVS